MGNVFQLFENQDINKSDENRHNNERKIDFYEDLLDKVEKID